MREVRTFGGQLPNMSSVQAAQRIGDELREEWQSAYDPSDPSMSDVGQVAWDEQVEQAVEFLEGEVVNAIDDVWTCLINGDYYVDKE